MVRSKYCLFYPLYQKIQSTLTKQFFLQFRSYSDRYSRTGTTKRTRWTSDKKIDYVNTSANGNSSLIFEKLLIHNYVHFFQQNLRLINTSSSGTLGQKIQIQSATTAHHNSTPIKTIINNQQSNSKTFQISPPILDHTGTRKRQESIAIETDYTPDTYVFYENFRSGQK